jgi:hypothetical protein
LQGECRGDVDQLGPQGVQAGEFGVDVGDAPSTELFRGLAGASAGVADGEEVADVGQGAGRGGRSLG